MLLNLHLCSGLGESAGPTGQGSLSLLLTPPSVSSLGDHLSLHLVIFRCIGCSCAVTETRQGPWTPRWVWQTELSWSCCRPEQGCMWALGCELWAAPVHPLQYFRLLAACSQTVRLTKCSFTVYVFFLLVMQCSASLDVLFLLDGSYSIGKGSFERSKHFAGKLCDVLDIHPDRVSVRNISSNFQTVWQCV